MNASLPANDPGLFSSKIRWILHLGILCCPIGLAIFRNYLLPAPQTIGAFAGTVLLQLLIWGIAFAAAFSISGITARQLYLESRNPWKAARLGFRWFVIARIALAFLAWLELQVIDPRWSWVAEEKIFASIGGHDISRHPALALLVYAMAAVIFGLTEELWRVGMFRGVAGLSPHCKEKSREAVISIVGIALLYGAAHLYQGPFGMQNSILLGIFLGLVLLYRRSYLDIAIAHALFDASIFGVLAYMVLNPYAMSSQMIKSAAESDFPQVRHLISMGADPNFPSPDGTALEAAARGSSPELVRFLLQRGANPNLKDSLGQTPLIVAAEGNQPQIVELLLARGADLNWQDSRGFTALRAATQYDRAQAARALVSRGADPNLRDKEGKTPLSVAQEMGYYDVMAMLPENAEK